MTSGIYKFTFRDGSYYIGKSADIEKRWKQHVDAMQKGKHSVNVQGCCDVNGLPSFEILLRCHEHHIDILESYYIRINWGDRRLLNKTKPADLEPEDWEIIDQIPLAAWEVSTFEHFRQWSEVQNKLNAANAELEAVKSGTKIWQLEQELRDAKKRLSRVANVGLWDRIFNWETHKNGL